MQDADSEPDDGVGVGGDEADDVVVGDLPGKEWAVPVARVGCGPPEHLLVQGLFGPRGGGELEDHVEILGGRSPDTHRGVVSTVTEAPPVVALNWS